MSDRFLTHAWGRPILLVGVACLGFNLRPVAISIGPVLNDLIDSFRLTGAGAGVLTTMPVLVFGICGLIAPSLARRMSMSRLLLVALLALAGGAGARAQAHSFTVFLLMSLLALAGMATANVLIPSAVKLYFPKRVRFGTSLYTTAMAIGQTLAAVLTVPVGRQLGHANEVWRAGLQIWALTAVVAAAPWMLLSGPDRTRKVAVARQIGLRQVAGTRLAWALAVFFGLQSLQAYAVYGWFAVLYRDAGASATSAGLLLGLVTSLSIPIAFFVPRMTRRMVTERWVMLALVSCYPTAYLGMMLSPSSGAWLWAALVGIGGGAFPLALTQIGLRTRSGPGAAALSGFTQAIGYAIAAVGPLGMGYLHDMTGAWDVPLAVLTVLSVPQMLAGLAVTRSAPLEDSLPGAISTPPSMA